MLKELGDMVALRLAAFRVTLDGVVHVSNAMLSGSSKQYAGDGKLVGFGSFASMNESGNKFRLSWMIFTIADSPWRNCVFQWPDASLCGNV